MKGGREIERERQTDRHKREGRERREREREEERDRERLTVASLQLWHFTTLVAVFCGTLITC